MFVTQWPTHTLFNPTVCCWLYAEKRGLFKEKVSIKKNKMCVSLDSSTLRLFLGKHKRYEYDF